MHTCTQAAPRRAGDLAAVLDLHTTLYDLIDATDMAVDGDADDAITATVAHILNTYRVICRGNFAGYRLVCDDGASSAVTSPGGAGGT
jgi:hypothetical protein